MILYPFVWVSSPCPPGHSRSIVGVEERTNGSLCLLVLDPDSGLANARKVLCADGLPAAMRHIRRFPSNMKHRQYQVVCVDQVLSPEEKQVSVRKPYGSVKGGLPFCEQRMPLSFAHG